MNKASKIAESSDVKHKTKPNVFYNQESLKSNFTFLPLPGNTKSNNLSQNVHRTCKGYHVTRISKSSHALFSLGVQNLLLKRK